MGNFGTGTVSLIQSTNGVIRGSTGVEIDFLLPVVSAPFRLIFAYNPQTFDGVINLGTTPIPVREPNHNIQFTIGRSF
jgi:outer membrane protein assembly factor BamA